MARLILHSPYYKPSRSKAFAGYVSYIATRSGVQMPENTKRHKPATQKQRELVAELIRTIPPSKDFFEYADYVQKPTIKNASEFIGRVMDTYPEAVQDRKDYVQYVATRPGVQKTAQHGLFTDYGVPVVLDQVAKEVGSHAGNVWTHIISLRREDAERLQFNNVKAWQNLLCAQRNEIARHMKIKPENFRWYAAFHNQTHHPHVHMIAYSVDPKEPYLTKKGIQEIKSSLAAEIFKADLYSLYRRQTQYRDRLKQDAEQIIDDAILHFYTAAANPAMEMLLGKLAEKLKNTSGKKVYGYLPPDTKALVDTLIDEIASDKGIQKLYDLWYEQKFEILRTYTDEMPNKVPLSENKEFRSLKNIVIREALTLDRQEEAAEISIHHTRSFLPGSASMGVLRLAQQICSALQDRLYRKQEKPEHTERKLQRDIDEKKQAHGLRQ